MKGSRQKDGGYGWVVVFAFFTSSVIIDALRYAFGLLYIEFLSEFNQGKGTTAWIGSVLICVYNILGPLIAAGIYRFGVRASAIVGSVIGAAGLASCALVHNIYVMFFTYGFVQGVGLGMMFLSGWVAVSRIFERRRGLALGLAQCGCGVGAFVISPLLRLAIDEYRWRGAMLLLAGTCLNGCVLAMLYRPVLEEVDVLTIEKVDEVAMTSATNRGDNEVTVVDAANGKTSESGKPLLSGHSMSGNRTLTQSEGKVNGHSASETEHPKRRRLFRSVWCFKDSSEDAIPRTFYEMREEQLNNYKLAATKSKIASSNITMSSNRSIHSVRLSPIILGSNASLEQIVAKRRLNAQLSSNLSIEIEPPTKEDESNNYKQFSRSFIEELFPRRLVTDIRLILMMVSAVFYCLPTFIPISLIADYGRIVGCSESSVVWFVSAMGIGGTVGRLLCGWAVDLACVNRVWFLGGMLLVSSVSTMLLPLLTTFPLLMLYSLTYGISIGCLYVVPAILLMDMFGEALIPQIMGVFMYVSGVSAIMGTPIAGWLFDVTQSYTASFLFCGGMYMCSVLINMTVLCIPKHKQPGQAGNAQ